MAARQQDPNEWLKYGNVDERYKRFLLRTPGGSTVLVSVALIAAGVLLFLANLGLMPIDRLWQFWPAIGIVFGISLLSGARTIQAKTRAGFIIMMSTVFLLVNLDVLHVHHDASWPISILLIIAGFIALQRVMYVREPPAEAPPFAPGSGPRSTSYENVVNDLTVFGSLKRKSESQAFAGGDLMAIFGNIEIDLRRAAIPFGGDSAVLNANAVFGAVKVRVPDSWNIVVSGSGILGNFEDKTGPANTGKNAGVLVITGMAVFGSVEIED